MVGRRLIILRWKAMFKEGLLILHHKISSNIEETRKGHQDPEFLWIEVSKTLEDFSCKAEENNLSSFTVPPLKPGGSTVWIK